MYKEFKIKNFRCFEDFEIKNLKRINLFAGKNNVGKTALLEALFIHAGGFNPELLIRVNTFRGIETIKVDLYDKSVFSLNFLFLNFDTLKKIHLKSKDSKNKVREVSIDIPDRIENIKEFQDLIGQYTELVSKGEIKIVRLKSKEKDKEKTSYLAFTPKGLQFIPFPPPQPSFPAIFLPSKLKLPHSETAERFSKLAQRKEENLVVEILQIVEPSLKSLLILSPSSIPMLYGDIGDSRIPLPLMGEGMVKLTELVLSIASAQNGIVLIDEFENGIHYSALVDVWKAVMESAEKFNCQIFATTHSFECIKAAHRAFSEMYPEQKDYDFSFYRLEKVDNKIVAKHYDREALEGAIDIGLEVR